MAKILAIGNAALDIINTVDHYPYEDEEIRALAQRVTQGGNAANTLMVLSQAGHQCHWAGALADDTNSNVIIDAFKQANIEYQHAEKLSHTISPVSYITLNQQTGSRTIVHYRNLAEFSLQSLQAIDVGDYDWIHLEGRNIKVLEQFLTGLDQCRRPRISLEAEKNRPGIERLFNKVDVVMLSATFSFAGRDNSAEETLQLFHTYYPKAIASRTAGAQGAYMLYAGEILYQPGFKPDQVVDTVGAGDVFNALVIDGLLSGLKSKSVLYNACYYAGKKCSQIGYQHLLD